MVFLEKGNRTFYRLMSFDCNSVLRSSMSCKDGRQCGRVVSTSDSQSGGPGFESRSVWPLAGFVLGPPELKSSATL